jgi:hypothetical protein
MSSFFNRQPEMFDPKKRLGVTAPSNSTGTDQNSDEGECIQGL